MSKKNQSITLKELRKRGILRKGAWFAFPIDPDEQVILTSKMTGVEEEQVFSNNEKAYHLFRYAGESTFDIFEFKGEPLQQQIKLYGRQGFFEGHYALNMACDGLINSMIHGITAYAMTEEDFRELPDYLKDGDGLLSGERATIDGEHLMIPAVRKGKLTYKTLYRQGSGEYGVCGAIIPKAYITASDARVQVIIDDTPERGSTREMPYEIIFADKVSKDENTEKNIDLDEDNPISKEAIEQVIASVEKEIKNVKIALRHAEISLSGLKEIANKLK